MKKILILLAVLAVAATPMMASAKLEASHTKKQSLKHHVETKHQKKHLTKRQTKQSQKKLAKRNGIRKHKTA
jgi:Ni/Co efflux regulator RcnB